MPYYYKKRRKRINKRTIKFDLGVTILCLFVAAALSFLTYDVPRFVKKKVEGLIIAKAEQTLGKKLDAGTVERLKKAYDSGAIDMKHLDRAKRGGTGEKESADLEKLMKQARDRGEIDTATIERAKEAYGKR